MDKDRLLENEKISSPNREITSLKFKKAQEMAEIGWFVNQGQSVYCTEKRPFCAGGGWTWLV